MITLHTIGLPHTIPTQEATTCAFTTKLFLLPRAIASSTTEQKFHVIEYANEGSTSSADEHVVVLTKQELKSLTKRKHERNSLYDDDVSNRELNMLFYNRLIDRMRKRVRRHDIVCHVFGPLKSVHDAFPQAIHVETGIGYSSGSKPQQFRCPYRIFESQSWMHYHLGAAGIVNGNNYYFVINNYADTDQWPLNMHPRHNNRVVYFGRIVVRKGLHTLVECARSMADWEFVLYGQHDGDIERWTNASPHDNIKYGGVVTGTGRHDVLSNATCVLAPTTYVEPWCNTTSEAMLCGTPVIATPWGVHPEKIRQGVDGWCCHTLADYVEAIRRSPTLDRREISERAHSLWNFKAIGNKYVKAFEDVHAIHTGLGWYGTSTSMFGGVNTSASRQVKWVVVRKTGTQPRLGACDMLQSMRLEGERLRDTDVLDVRVTSHSADITEFLKNISGFENVFIEPGLNISLPEPRLPLPQPTGDGLALE